MMFDMKQARDANTTSVWTKTIWRVFVDGKLFVSDDHKTVFDTESEARNAFYDSFLWRKVTEYIDYSQRFFDKVGDDDWREEFTIKIYKNLGVKLKEYKCEFKCDD